MLVRKNSVSRTVWRVEFRDPILPGYELVSRGIESSLQNWQLQNNGKVRIRL
jgi:hypothetical protein